MDIEQYFFFNRPIEYCVPDNIDLSCQISKGGLSGY